MSTLYVDRRATEAKLDAGAIVFSAEGVRLATVWNWDVGAEFRISIKKPELQGLRP